MHIGDWGKKGEKPHPNWEIDFDCACVACVRASERSCVREMIPQWLGLAVRICGARRRRRPSVVRAEVPIDSSSFRNSDCILIAMTHLVFCGGGPVPSLVFRACFVRACVVGSWSCAPAFWPRSLSYCRRFANVLQPLANDM